MKLSRAANNAARAIVAIADGTDRPLTMDECNRIIACVQHAINKSTGATALRRKKKSATNGSPEIPTDFTFTTKPEDDMHVAWVMVPEALLDFAIAHHDQPFSPVIGRLHEGEVIFFSGEDFGEASERDRLIAEGWPVQFIDFIGKRTEAGSIYFRLYA